MGKKSGGNPPSSASLGKKKKQCQRYKLSGKHEQHKVRGMIRNIERNPCDKKCFDYLAEYVEKIGPSILSRPLVLRALETIEKYRPIRLDILVEKENRKQRHERRKFEKVAGYVIESEQVTQ